MERRTDSGANVIATPASFEDENGGSRVLRESAGEDEAGETATDDDKVVALLDVGGGNEGARAEWVWKAWKWRAGGQRREP
jgi:hypothetical protein